MVIKLDARPVTSARNNDADAAQAAGIGARLRDIRARRGLNLTAASQRTGVAHSTISKIERGDLSPTLSTIHKLAEGLGIEIVELIGAGRSGSGNGRRSVTRRNSETPLATNTCSNGWIASELANKKMLPFRTVVHARTVDEYSGGIL